MQPLDIKKIAEEWIKLHHLPSIEREGSAYFEAYDCLHDLVRNNPELAWSIMELIRNLDSSDLILSNLAAGPFEDLMVRHGAQFIQRVETLAIQDVTFQRLLGAVWQNKIPDELWGRIKMVAGPSF